MDSMKSFAFSLIATTVLAAHTLAQTTATTAPVGFTSHKVKANSDQKLGVPMQQASVLQGQATTVSGTTVTAGGITALSGAMFLVVTSGTADGKWEQIATSTAGSLTLAASIAGFADGDSFSIKPFWTLGSLLPNGGGLPASPDVYDPVASLFLNNPAAVGVNIAPSDPYIYHDGSERTAGWYNANDPDLGLADDTVVSPEIALMVRNSSPSEATLRFVGSVPVSEFSLDVVKRAAGPQDNLLYNKWPSDVTLGTSGLATSGAVEPSPDVYSPTDVVYILPTDNTGYNTAPSQAYLYHDGSERTAGWYDINDPDAGVKDTVPIVAGSSLIVRKQAGADATISWNPAPPYSL